MSLVRVWRSRLHWWRDRQFFGVHYMGRDRFRALGAGRHPYWRIGYWYVAIRWPDHAEDSTEPRIACYVCHASQVRHALYPKCRICGEPEGLLTAVEMLAAPSGSEARNG